jgi:hypothetical protein
MLKIIGTHGRNYLMPSYTLKNQKDERHDVIMSWTELQSHLEKNPNLKLVPSTPKIVSQQGTNLGKTSDGYKDLLKNMKAHAGEGANIKT